MSKSRIYSDIRRSGEGYASKRGLFALILCLLLPPIGLMFMWRKSVFRAKGRMVMTVAVTAWMTLFVVLLLPGAELDTVLPTPGQSELITAAPESNVKTALYNIDEILKDEIPDETVEPEETTTTEEETTDAEMEEILNTVVYCYGGGGNVQFYHCKKECNGQTNDRELTVSEAIKEGLGVCPNCNPVSPYTVDN